MNPDENLSPPEGVDYSFGFPQKHAEQARIPKVEQERSISPPPSAPVAASPNGEAPDSDYFYLTTPILVDGKEISRLRMNPKGVLKGREFFRLIDRYQRKFPDEARTNFNKFTSENFLSLVLAQINGIAPEDLYKVDYVDLPLLFLQAASFHFSGGRKATPPEEEEESPMIPLTPGERSSST